MTTASMNEFPVGTVLLSAATVKEGKIVLLGDLNDDTKESLYNLHNAIKGLASPENPMYVVEIKVVEVKILTRVLELDVSSIAETLRPAE